MPWPTLELNALARRVVQAARAGATAGMRRVEQRLAGVGTRDESLLQRAFEIAKARAASPWTEVDGIRQVTEYVRHTVFGRTDGEPPIVVAAQPGERVEHWAKADPRLWHLEHAVERRLDQLRRFADFQHAEDPVEAVHDFRVATRALRAYAAALEPFLDAAGLERAHRHLRRGTRALGKLRELDVSVHELERLREGATSDGERAALEHVLDRLERKRRSTERQARKKLEQLQLDQLREDFRAALGAVDKRVRRTPAGLELLAWLALEPAIESVSACSKSTSEHPEALHRLRILTKRLRYSVELFEPCLGAAHADLHPPLKRVQETLGDHHDRAVLLALVAKQRARLTRQNRTSLAQALLPVEARLLEGREQAFQAFQQHRHVLERKHLAVRAERALRPA